MDRARLPDDLSSELPSGTSEERIVARLVREYRGEVRPCRVPADEEALREVPFEEGRVLDDLQIVKDAYE